MASASFRFLSLTVLMFAGILAFGGHGVLGQCEASIPSLTSQCSRYVQVSGSKTPPSQGCCNVIKDLDVPCLCNLVTPELERLVSMEKVVFVARFCALTIQPGMKCGSFTVPPV